MSEYNKHVDATYERYDVEISYTCPKCGTKRFCSIKSGDVYWMLEAGLDVTCDKCGAEFLVWER